MPTYQQYQNQERLRRTQRVQYSDGNHAIAFILGYTLLSSYFLARASDNDVTTRERTLFYMANSLTNLYMFQYIRLSVIYYMIVILNQSSNDETFPLDPQIEWNTCTLERSNLVYRNGADAGVNYMVAIEGGTDSVLYLSGGASYTRSTTFFVASEAFNSQERQTVRNRDNGNKLNQIRCRIYDATTGNLATISNPFYLQLRFD